MRQECPDGTYSYQDRAYDISHCLTCPKGYYCPVAPASAAEKIVLCPAGYYCMGGNHDNSTNADGLYIIDGDANLKCPEGFYCPAGTNVPRPCDVGKYCAGTGNSAVSGSCQAGYTCELIKTDSATLGGIEFCMNEDSNLCYKGQSEDTGGNNVCPAGHYCTQGDFMPRPCPIGTFRTGTGGTSEDDCQECGAGKFCPSFAATSEGDYCEAGYYCETENANKFQYPCPAGSYCILGVSQLCDEGTYQPNLIQSSCKNCDSGYYCENKGMTAQEICPVGFYCAGQTITPVACPEGTFSNIQGLTSENDCQKGSFGYYYENEGNTDSSVGLECAAGYKCYHTDLTTAAGAFISSTGGTVCGDNEICPSGTAVPELCPPGTYTLNSSVWPRTQATSAVCGDCLQDYYCSEWGILEDDLSNGNYDCPLGYICNQKAIHPSDRDNIKVEFCPEGSFCDISIGHRNSQCPINWYTNIEGSSECFPCPKGFNCPELGTVDPIPCERGHYCISPQCSFT